MAFNADQDLAGLNNQALDFNRHLFEGDVFLDISRFVSSQVELWNPFMPVGPGSSIHVLRNLPLNG